MTVNQFWNDEPTLINIYYQAYMQRIHQEAHLQGYYTYIAMATALGNAFKEKGKKSIPYMEKPIITAETFKKSRETKQSVRKEYRSALQYQMNWVNEMSKN